VDLILRIIDAISEWSGRIFSFAVLVATGVVVYEVIMRYGFNTPTTWGYELPIYLAGATYMLSGAYTHLHDNHVRVDLLHGRWSARTRAVVDILTAPVFLVGMVALIYFGGDWTLQAFERGTTTGTRWNPPVWPLRALIPLGALLLLLQGLATLGRDFRTAISGVPHVTEAPPPPDTGVTPE
jgi:TRAP-type mannitol/chloroaromatic compound transport system permease small subunit